MRALIVQHKRLVALVVVCVVAAAVVLPFTLSSATTSQSNTVLILAKVQARTLQQTVQLTGTLARKDVEDISAESTALVSAVQATDGETVNAGQALFALNGRDAIAEPGDSAFFRSLAPGDVGSDVLELKQILTAAHDYPGPMTDQFTNQTQFALAQWQAQNDYPNTTPATPQTVNVQLEQGPGYQIGDQDAAGLVINPPPANTDALTTGGAHRATLLSYPRTSMPSLSIQAMSDQISQGQEAAFVITADTSSASDVTVNLGYGGSANPGGIISPPSTVTIPAGDTSAEVEVPTVATNQVGSNTTLDVSIDSGSGYDVGSPSSAETTIANNNVPQLQISGTTTVSPGGSATLTISADQAPLQATQVVLSFGGSASPGSDYTALNPVVTLPAGQMSVNVSLTTLPSTTIEPNKFVVVSLSPSPSSYSIGPGGSAVVTIAESSGLPTVTLKSSTNYVQKGEPDMLTIGLSSPLSGPLTINLSYGGTAVDGTDYDAPSGAIVVPPGQTALALSIPTVADNVVEANRTLTVSLAQSASYLIGSPASATATISSQVLPKLSIAANTATVTQGGAASFTITADQAPSQATSVNFTVQGTAQPGQAYNPIAGEALLPAGQTKVVVTIQSLQTDITFEPTDMIVAQWPIRVGTVYVKAGNTVAPGAPILELTEPNTSVTLQASASDRSNLAVGQSCTVQISGGTTQVSGTITELDATPTVQSSGGASGAGGAAAAAASGNTGAGGSSSQTYEGRIDSPDLAQLDGADGATVSITVVDQQVTNVPSVPIAALKQNGTGQDVVRVVDGSGAVTEVPVQTGLSEGSYIQIMSGVRIGETVLVQSDQG